MTICGRCHGRGTIKPLVGIYPMPCPACTKGIKDVKPSLGTRTVSVPLPPGATCKVCGEPAVHHHHVVSQSRINRYLPDELIRRQAKLDVRNLVALCAECHHRVEVGSLPLEPADLHPNFGRYVKQYDLAAALPRHLAEVVA